MKSKRVYTDYLRDMIEYAGKAVQVDLEVVWKTAHEDLPRMRKAV